MSEKRDKPARDVMTVDGECRAWAPACLLEEQSQHDHRVFQPLDPAQTARLRKKPWGGILAAVELTKPIELATKPLTEVRQGLVALPVIFVLGDRQPY